ncbi:MAG: tetratricopeptide repeat protein [Candidatus Omnitrophica bacterium]|nr:tetratricopeptide repeat protein [Candidatus Omnitrophota bacterium]
MINIEMMRLLFIISLIVLPFFSLHSEQLTKEQAVSYREEGYRLQSMGDLNGALTYYEKAAQMYPNYAEAYNDIGVVYEALGDNDKALSMYLKTLEINPEYLPAYTNLAFLYERRGEIENATTYWKKRYMAGQQGDYWWEVSRQHLLKLGTYPEVRKADLEEKAARLSRELIYVREQDRLKVIEEAKLHLDLGNNAFAAKDYETAAKEFRTVLSLNVDDDDLVATARKLYDQAERFRLRQSAYVNTKNALDYIEKDDFLSAGDKLKNALSAVFHITQEKDF